MERNRRQFIRGRWLAGAALPSPSGEDEIASILVQTRPERLDDAEAAYLKEYPDEQITQ